MCKFWRKEKRNHHFPELNHKQKTLSTFKKFFNPTKLVGLTVVLALGVGLVYLMQTNVSATQGYQIRGLENQIQELQKINKKMNLDYIELQSMANIIDQASQFDLVVVKDMKVIDAMGSAVALK